MQGFWKFSIVNAVQSRWQRRGCAPTMKGVFMNLKKKPLPKFEVSASYENYAEGGYLMDAPQQSGTCGDECAQACADCESVAAEPDAASMSTGDDQSAQTAAAAESDATTGAQAEFEAAVDEVVTCVYSQNALREVLYKTLAHCTAPQPFDEVEDFISHQDEFVYSHIIQEPFTLASMLVNAGGLSQTPIDDDGNVIAEETLAGMTDDEACDAIASYLLQTTPAGLRAADLLSPDRRISAQIAKVPHRADTYYAVMQFCETPRKFPEIEAFYKNNDCLAKDVVAESHKLSPDYYVDKLDKAGALVWRGAWVLTEAGQRALASRNA